MPMQRAEFRDHLEAYVGVFGDERIKKLKIAPAAGDHYLGLSL
jgi:hypothetical protein